MRQLIVQVPLACGDRALEAAGRHGAVNVTQLHGTDADGQAVALIILHLSNDRAGDLIDALGSVPGLRVSMLPTGALALHPPASHAADQTTDVTARSPLEVFVAGLQSIGSWTGFLGYAVAGGMVVWIGLTTNTVYLLIGAMLIAPFAGPAVNTAIATARGDAQLLWRSLLRYGAAIAVTAAVAGLLSLLFQQDAATELMRSVSTISSTAVLLPLIAGAAGALHLCQGESSSLVSGAASGMLIAASLAPPAGLIGIATATGDLVMLAPALFLLGLQLVGINLAGALTFWMFGLRPDGVRYKRGRHGVRLASGLATAGALAMLLTVQFATSRPTLEHASVAQEMRDAVLVTLAADSSVAVVEANLRFTRATIRGQSTLLAVLYVQRSPWTTGGDDVLRERISSLVRHAIASRAPEVTPLAAVTILPP